MSENENTISVNAHCIDEALRQIGKECVSGPYYDRKIREAEFVTVRVSGDRQSYEWVFKLSKWNKE